jgi:hypothetical protein
MAPQVEGQGKAPLNVVEAVRQTLRHLAQQEIVLVQMLRRAIAVLAHGVAVEDLRRRRFPGPAHGSSAA